MLRIAKGLKATYKNASGYTLPQALLELDKYTDNYEVLNAEHNRLYGDIDGKDIQGTEEEFNAIDLATRTAIETFLKGEDYALMTASSFIHKKVSWRFVIKNRKASLEDNKKWVQVSIPEIALPEGIRFDDSPYGKNQKIRMLKSNKDGENRPLRLVKGEVIDTLISYIPEGCELMEMKKEKKEKKKKTEAQPERIDSALLSRLVMNITNDETISWEQWYKISQAIYNERGSEDLFLAWSSKSPKHNDREASLLWKSLKEGDGLTAGSLYYWSQQSNPTEHEKIIVENCPVDSYPYIKANFEKTHFKVMYPPSYIRLGDTIQTLNDGQLDMMYRNLFYMMKTKEEDIKNVFHRTWITDETIRTYERIVFKPKQIVPPTDFNIFTGFSCPAIEGDCSVMNELMWMLSGENQEVFEYIESYFAHMIQKPYEKPGVAIIFMSSRQGAGKDTPLDFIGSILGREYFFNTEDAENQVFGRFTEHLQRTLFLKMEEVEFETNKKNESAFLSLITATTRSYEGKGQKPIVLDDYKRMIGTTNKSVPVNIPQSDRRFVLVNSSEKRVGDTAFWDNVFRELAKPETKHAYHYHLLNKDISNFNIRIRPTTDFYKEVKQTLRPYHASYFQSVLEMNSEAESLSWNARDLFNEMNAKTKFPVSETKFGRDMKTYGDVFTKQRLTAGNRYNVDCVALRTFIEKMGWWVEL